MRALLLAAALGAALCADGIVVAQTPKPDELVPRATAYVHHFIERFSNVVAEERYEQRITSPRRTRVLTSDFLLVRYASDDLWRAFRDVEEVDGKPVRDREDRMQKLFLEPPENALTRARQLAEAGARFNLVDIGSINNPLLALAFLQRQYVDRFRINVAGLDRNLGDDIRTVRFVEFVRPTLLKRDASQDMFSSGLWWIEEATGRVVKTELQLGSRAFPIRITTTYSFDEELGINVPAAMEDWYADGRGEFTGKATYGKFRRFEVRTDETVGR